MKGTHDREAGIDQVASCLLNTTRSLSFTFLKGLEYPGRRLSFDVDHEELLAELGDDG